MARSRRCTSGASGVVMRAACSATSAPGTCASTVPRRPARAPEASRIEVSRCEVVVLPSVPVTPMTVSSRPGWPWRAAAARASEARASSTATMGASPGRWRHDPRLPRSTTTAAAPAASASARKAWPSTVKPGTATKSAPGATRRESCSTLSTTASPSPRTISAPGMAATSEASTRALTARPPRDAAAQRSSVRRTSRKFARMRAVAPQIRCSPQR